MAFHNSLLHWLGAGPGFSADFIWILWVVLSLVNIIASIVRVRLNSFLRPMSVIVRMCRHRRLCDVDGLSTSTMSSSSSSSSLRCSLHRRSHLRFRFIDYGGLRCNSDMFWMLCVVLSFANVIAKQFPSAAKLVSLFDGRPARRRPMLRIVEVRRNHRRTDSHGSRCQRRPRCIALFAGVANVAFDSWNGFGP